MPLKKMRRIEFAILFYQRDNFTLVITYRINLELSVFRIVGYIECNSCCSSDVAIIQPFTEVVFEIINDLFLVLLLFPAPFIITFDNYIYIG